ncbi:MAG: T9SS type A sorting domain-containing protein [Bacteroidota bacterium]
MLRCLMMVVFLVGTIGWQANAQKVSSSCELEDVPSVDSLLWEDARLLAERQQLSSENISLIPGGMSLPDSLIRPIFDALVAVHNAAGLSARREVVENYNIHVLESNPFGIELVVAEEAPWLGNLLDSKEDIDPVFDELLLQYKLQIQEHFRQTYGDWVVRLVATDGSIHAAQVQNEFLEIEGVELVRQSVLGGSLWQDIVYTEKEDHRELVYRYSWGSCNTGCAFDHFWKFRIYEDCSVEFVDQFGTPLAVADLERLIQVSLFPNPSADLVNISLLGPTQRVLQMGLYDARGRLLQSRELYATDGHFGTRVSLQSLPVGMYFLSFQDGNSVLTAKVMRW